MHGILDQSGPEPGLSRRAISLVAIVAAVLVFASGMSYALVRHVKYQSGAELVLVPTSHNSAQIANLTSSFVNSGVLGTYVEYLSALDPGGVLNARHVSLSVRGVPDTAAIDISATGSRSAVRASLQAVIDYAQALASSLNDAWTLRTLNAAGRATQAGPGVDLILGASALLAMLVGLFVYAVLDRLFPRKVVETTTPDMDRLHRGTVPM